MDSTHKIDAPDNDELTTIDPVGDRINLSSLYPNPHNQWTGEIVSAEERDRLAQTKQTAFSLGIRKYFLTIGLLIPLPFILTAVILTAALVYITGDNVTMFIVPGIFAFFVLLGITITSFRKLSNLFYMNDLRALPYSIILLTLLGIIFFMVYYATSDIHDYQPLPAVALVSAITILISISLNYFLLLLWTTPVINSGLKVLIMVVIALALLGTGVYLSIF